MENVVNKSDRRGEVIRFEITSIGKLNGEDMRRLPEEARNLLKESATGLAVPGRRTSVPKQTLD